MATIIHPVFSFPRPLHCADTVLDTRSRAAELQFRHHLSASALCDAVAAHQRGVADEAECDVCDFHGDPPGSYSGLCLYLGLDYIFFRALYECDDLVAFSLRGLKGRQRSQWRCPMIDMPLSNSKQ